MGDVNLLYYTAGYTLSEEKGEDWLASWPKRVDELSQRLEQRLAPGQDVFSAGRSLAVEELKARPQGRFEDGGEIDGEAFCRSFSRRVYATRWASLFAVGILFSIRPGRKKGVDARLRRCGQRLAPGPASTLRLQPQARSEWCGCSAEVSTRSR